MSDYVSALALLTLDLNVLFVMSESGRIVRVNSPDAEPPPRCVLAGCCSGNLVRLRDDVGERTALEVAALVGDQPPWFDPFRTPPCLDPLVRLLSREAAVEAITRGIIYTMPNGVAHKPGAIPLVCDHAPEGRALAARLASEGMPQAVVDAGFFGVDDFWPPWCVALDGGDIASVAFAARLGTRAAEVGVYTLPGCRGRGLAGAVTARWSSLAELADRRLFYSTLVTNGSSQRVAERLGLARLGASLSLA